MYKFVYINAEYLKFGVFKNLNIVKQTYNINV